MNGPVALLLSAWLAHDLYLMPERFRAGASEKVTVAFHNGDDFPVPDRPPRLANILDAALRSRAGSSAFENLRDDGKVLRAEVNMPAQGGAVLAFRTRPNFIELEAGKFEEYLRHEGLTAVIAWRAKNGESASAGRERYSKYVKSILHVNPAPGEADGFFKQPAGLAIEIVPLKDPAKLAAGGELPVQLLVRGRPAADLQVEMAWLAPDGKPQRKVAGRTAKDGKLAIPIASRGVWKLHSVYMERCQEPAVADWESLWTSLTFEVF